MDRAHAELTTCLAFPRLTIAARAHALQARAWVHYTKKEYAAAIADAEAAFRLKPASRESDLIYYAVALRRVGRLDDSLQALALAEKLTVGGASSAVEEQRGLVLAQSGRHNEAIEAFSRMLKPGEFNPGAYWRRGLLYERIGKPYRAREDFEECVRLLSSKSQLPPELATLLPKVRAKLAEAARQ